MNRDGGSPDTGGVTGNLGWCEEVPGAGDGKRPGWVGNLALGELNELQQV